MKKIHVSFDVGYPEFHIGPPEIFIVTQGRPPDSRMVVLVRSFIFKRLSKNRREVLEIFLMWLIGRLSGLIVFIKRENN